MNKQQIVSLIEAAEMSALEDKGSAQFDYDQRELGVKRSTAGDFEFYVGHEVSGFGYTVWGRMAELGDAEQIAKSVISGWDVAFDETE